jgi:hypothetical protein
MSEREEKTALVSRPVRKRTIYLHSVAAAAILACIVYNRHIHFSLPKINLSALGNQILDAQTFPDSNDPRARCSQVMKKPWYQRSPCWQD